jgi:hypothetical protein
MNIYRHAGNIKAGLFILGLLLVVALIAYTQRLVDNLREDNREIVKLYAELIASTAAQQSNENLNFIFENIIKKVQFPVIQSDPDHRPQSWRNLPPDIDTPEEAARYQVMMDRQNEPIPLIYRDPTTGEELIFGYLHYGDSKLIQRLVWLPYFEIGAAALFILLGFAGFTIIRNSEKRHIWVGMARETAHQLATPVSALMGWVDWLKGHPNQAEDIIPDMEADLRRLEQVGQRFSKIGSESIQTEENLKDLIDQVVQYLGRRLPTIGKRIELVNLIGSDATVKVNGTLLTWAVENVIKNGIDAIDHDHGRIEIDMRRQPGQVVITVSDNGRGIPRKNWKNIFRPGYSTKERGWGLGLSLTRRIIHDVHQGYIRVVESKPGQGTRFEIGLPQ